MKIVTSAPNKIILCGEHFVVYGAPALAIPTNNRNRVVLTSKNGEPRIILKSNLGQAIYVPNEDFEGAEVFRAFIPVVNYVLKDNDIDETLEIEIFHSGAPKGMGSSSSLGAAVGLALFEYLGKEPTDSDLFECGQLLDEIAHGGKPSGIDARTICRGKPQKFQRSFEPSKFDFEDIDLELPSGSVLVVVDTFKGARETTGELIEKFGRAHGITKEPSELTYLERQALLAEYLKVYEMFVEECNIDGNAQRLGQAFNKNHQLLTSVSTPEIEDVRKTVAKNGAYGAKLTGAGGKGGAVIALVPKSVEQTVIKELKNKGYSAFSVGIAQEGVKVEGRI